MKTPSWINNQSDGQLVILDVVGSAGYAAPGNSNSSITLNLGIAYSGEVYTQDAMLFGTPGITSIPVGPGDVSNVGEFTASNTSASSAQAVAWVRNDKYVVLATRDTRAQQTPGNLGPGDTCVYATQGQAKAIFKADGSISVSTTDDQTLSGSLIAVNVTPTGISLVTPWASLTLDQSGIHASTITGTRLDMNGTPDPTTGGSAVVISAGIFTSNCAISNLGPITGAYLPAIISMIPVAIPGVPIMGAGVGAVVVAAEASCCVNLGIT